MRPTNPLTLALLATALLSPPALGADSLELTPGLWRTRSTHSMERPGMPAMPPRSDETTQCLRDSSFDPNSLFGDQPECRVEDVVVEGSVMTFRVTCPSPRGQMTGQARYESHGDRGSAQISLEFSAGGHTGKMTMKMESERIGDCDG